MSQITAEDTDKGQKVYTPLSLKLYNLIVLKLSNTFAWRCHSKNILALYSQHITSQHLDVGVGTGYFLQRTTFPNSQPNLGLLDLNEHCLNYTKNLLARYQPITYHGDIYQPLTMVNQSFDSIALNYVLHCLPGSFSEKATVISNIKQLLTDDGVLFGATILAKNQQHNWLGKKLLTFYNKKGIFSNLEDDLQDLESMLKQHFSSVHINVIGTVALFVAKNKLSNDT